MKLISTREMIFALEISAVSLYAWIKEGLPVIRQTRISLQTSRLTGLSKTNPTMQRRQKAGGINESHKPMERVYA